MDSATTVMPAIPVIDLGTLSYESAWAAQREHHAAVLAARDAGVPVIGRLLFVEHVPPVITVSRRPDARKHLVASAEELAREGVEVRETDRGGDITYHGPGQLVAYPIVDLNTLGLNLHGYMRFLEEVVIRTLARFGVEGHRDPGATGVWVMSRNSPVSEAAHEESSTNTRMPPTAAKICAIGVRVRRWVTMHGLALNVSTNLAHFDLIVPCGLAGRGATSLRRELEDECPLMQTVKDALAGEFQNRVARPG